ncbi:MAG: hypothetical protein EXR71_11055 [Myxococcales bacterium]|nr:hypothetical protein [Myxococcales bacterium]
MSTKICPNCNAEVPAIANLCKHCFHDFHYVAPKKKSPVWTLLFLGVGTSFVMASIFAFMYGQQKVTTSVVDRETKSMVFTTKTPHDVTTDRVYWKDISAVEDVRHAKPVPYQVWVVKTDGSRYLYAEDTDTLTIEAFRLAEKIGKTVVPKDASAER